MKYSLHLYCSKDFSEVKMENEMEDKQNMLTKLIEVQHGKGDQSKCEEMDKESAK